MTDTDKKGVLEDGLLRIKEASAFSGWSVAFIYKLMRQDELVYVKVGRSRRIPRRALIELAEKHLLGGQ